MVLAYATAGCGDEPIDERGAAELWQRIQTEDYRSWQRAPGWETRQPTVSAHGQSADIFIDPTMTGALEQDGADWPVGSAAVKDSYRGEQLVLIAAMERRAGGWFFAEWSASGAVKYGGTPDVCRDCHGGSAGPVRSIPLR